MTLATLSPDLQPFYEERLNKWSCKKCNNIIKNGYKNHQEICEGLPRAKRIEAENAKIAPFYKVEGKQWLCLKCNQDIKSKRLQHYQSCLGIGTRRKQLEYVALNPNLYSKHCDMGCGKNSQFFHKCGKAYCCKFGAKCPIKVAKDKALKDGIDPFKQRNIPHPRGMLGKSSWNKGKKSLVPAWNKGMTGIKGCVHTEETKLKLSKKAKERGMGGYIKGSGRGKNGWYKEFWCDSSWELAYILYCHDNNIKIERNRERRSYVFENTKRTYLPDFTVEGIVTEIKGYESPQWLAKLAANPDIKVLYEEDMKPILKYVREKYGKDFILLYEKKIK